MTGLCPIRDCPSSATRGVTGLYPHGDCPSSAAAGYGMRIPGPGLESTSIPPPTSAMSDLFGSFKNYFVSHIPAFASSFAHASNTQGGSIPSALGAPPSDTRSTPPPPPPLHFSWGRGAFAFGLHSLPLALRAVGLVGSLAPGIRSFGSVRPGYPPAPPSTREEGFGARSGLSHRSLRCCLPSVYRLPRLFIQRLPRVLVLAAGRLAVFLRPTLHRFSGSVRRRGLGQSAVPGVWLPRGASDSSR